MNDTYRSITGRRFDLTPLPENERRFLREVLGLYETRPPCSEFMATWRRLANEALWKGKRIPITHPVRRICQDLTARLGIAQGRIARPDYRDRLADLIEERFRSRYAFCKRAGIDEAQLSRVLHQHAHFSTEVLVRILEVLGVELGFVRPGDVAEAWPLETDTLERLREVERDLRRLAGLKRSRDSKAPTKARFPGPTFDEIRHRIATGERRAVVIADVYVKTLGLKTKLAKAVAREAAEEEKAERKAAS